jgi:hypothetical protein
MKNIIKNLFICFALILSILSVLSFEAKAQTECGTQDIVGSLPYVNDFFGGYFKPHRTDRDNGNPSPTDATLNMLFVFVEFTDENIESGEWPIGHQPTYMGKFLVKDKNGSGNFWDRYKDSSLSDYYQEISKGAFHVTGEARYLITNYPRTRYLYDTGYVVLLNEIYTKLKNDLSIDWIKFDLWSRNNSTNNYVYAKDKYLDMMGLFFRTSQNSRLFCANAAGYTPLCGPSFTIYATSTDTVKISPDRSSIGSGFVAIGNLGPLGFNRAFGIAIHEYGHYLFANNHSTSGIMTSNGELSVNDLFMSGYEKYKLGLLDTLTVNFSNQSVYTIGDISGRNGSPQILKVPISSSEFFIIENRRKISQYDVYMLGDTSQNDPFRNTGEYGNGIYIYHSNSVNLNYAGNVDIECADGLWNWSTFGYEHPDWTDADTVQVKLRSSLPSVINNDPGTTFFNSSTNADGISAGPWFSIGKKHLSVGLTGTDRVFTNIKEYWTSRERWGDRWDSWNIGYNEIFSPYSNPNTKTSGNANSEIFIYYNNLNNGIANLKIYKVNEPFTETEILAITPPSKPMGINVDYFVETENYLRPIITWIHNREPDMLRTDLKKRYKIWRATQANMSYVPTNYTLLNTLDIDSGTAPSFVDTSIVAFGSSWPGMGSQIQYPVRYTVQAIDKYADSSVRSDFGSIIGLTPNIGCAE